MWHRRGEASTQRVPPFLLHHCPPVITVCANTHTYARKYAQVKRHESSCARFHQRAASQEWAPGIAHLCCFRSYRIAREVQQAACMSSCHCDRPARSSLRETTCSLSNTRTLVLGFRTPQGQKMDVNSATPRELRKVRKWIASSRDKPRKGSKPRYSPAAGVEVNARHASTHVGHLRAGLQQSTPKRWSAALFSVLCKVRNSF